MKASPVPPLPPRLFVGGPADGTTCHVPDRPFWNRYPGMPPFNATRYERRTIRDKATARSWVVYVHGAPPPGSTIVATLERLGIAPDGAESARQAATIASTP